MTFKQLTDYSSVVAAGILYAIALKYFVLPSNVILTGTEGIAAALSYYFEQYWLFVALYVIFQSLLLFFAFKRVSRNFALRSLIIVTTITLWLSILPEFKFAQPEPQNERIILVIFGGLLTGVAKAIAFRKGGSTGDEDILGAYFAMKYLKPVGSISVYAAAGSTIFGLMMALLKSGAFTSAINTLMYTCIYIFISTETLNNFYHKFKIVLLVIITRQPQFVGDSIKDTSPHRTYITQEGIGGHSGNSFHLVKAIITHEELPATIAAIERVDPECLHYHHDIEGISRRYYIPPIA